MDSITREILQQATDAYQKVAGIYATEPVRWKQAREILIKQHGFTKHANFGENANPQFERAFGSIAFTYLQEKAPGLLPYILGFQLLDRSDGGNRAVGQFTAKLGNRILDIPMFFIDGELKGHQFMRLRQPELFVPLRESFLDYLFSRLPQDIGHAEGNLTSHDPTRSSPNVRPFSGSRYMNKGASDKHLRPWAKEAGVADAYRDMLWSMKRLKVAQAVLNNEPLPGVDLMELLTASETMLKAAKDMSVQYPTFGQKMSQLHGDDWYERSAQVLEKAKPTKHASLQLPTGNGLRLGTPRAKQAGSLRIMRDVPKHALHMDKDAVRAEIARYGYYAADSRPMDKVAKAYKIDEGPVTYSPPNCCGVFKVLYGDELHDTIVFPSKDRIGSYGDDLLIRVKDKAAASVCRDDYVAIMEGGESTHKSLKEMMTLKNRPKVGDVFLVCTVNGLVAGPYIATEKHAPGKFDVSVLCNPCGDASVEFRDDYDRSHRCVDRTRIFGGGAKVWAFNKCEIQTKSCGPLPDWDSVKEITEDPTESDNIDLTEMHKYANLVIQVQPTGSVMFNDTLVGPSQARLALMRNCNLHKDAADKMLAITHDVQRYRIVQPGETMSLYRLKNANQVDRYYSPSVDFPAEDNVESDESGRYGIQPTQSEIEESDPMERTQRELQPWEDAEGQNSHMQDRPISGNNPHSELDALFDSSGLLSLIRNNRIDHIIRRATQALLKSTDALGAALLSLYAHNDEFVDMYGEEALEALESDMISQFEAGGDLFINLTRRSSDPHPELDVNDAEGLY